MCFFTPVSDEDVTKSNASILHEEMDRTTLQGNKLDHNAMTGKTLMQNLTNYKIKKKVKKSNYECVN